MTLDMEALRRLRTLADTTEASAIAMTLPELDSILVALGRIPLAALGFDAEWGCLSAASVGASQLRERLFLLAYRPGERGECGDLAGGPDRASRPDAQRERRTLDNAGRGRRRQGAGAVPARQPQPGPVGGAVDAESVGEREQDHASPAVGGERARSGAGGRSEFVGMPDGGGWVSEHRSGDEQGGGDKPDGAVAALGHASGERLEGRLAGLGSRERLPFPPGPRARDEWAAVLAERPDLAPAVEPSVRLLADGLAGGMVRRWPVARADELRTLGNGVVPLAAAVAFLALAERAGGGCEGGLDREGGANA